MSAEFPLLNAPPDPAVPTVASDLEGTLTSGITVMAIHKCLEINGRAEASKAVYRRLMPNYTIRKLFRLNLREIKNEWMRALVRCFKGLALEEVRSMSDWVVEQSIWGQRREMVVEELLAHRAAGRRVVIVSGMPTLFLESLLTHLPGFEAIGTGVLPGEDDRFSGEVDARFNVGAQKTARLEAFAPPAGKIYGAYGDTYPDRHMLEMSEYPVAVHPDKKLRRAAAAAGWRILEETGA